jgi:hypothetical protein
MGPDWPTFVVATDTAIRVGPSESARQVGLAQRGAVVSAIKSEGTMTSVALGGDKYSTALEPPAAGTFWVRTTDLTPK